MTFAYSTPGTTDRLLSGILQQTTATDKFTQEFRLLSPESDALRVAARRVLHGRGFRHQSAELRWRSRPAPTTLPRTSPPWRWSASTPRTRKSRCSRTRPGTSRRSSTCPSAAAGATTTRPPSRTSGSSFRRSCCPAHGRHRAELRQPEVLRKPVHVVGFAALRDLGHVVRLRARRDRIPPGRAERAAAGSGAPATYDSDELTNYEIGLRTGTRTAPSPSTSPRSILDWKDIQLFQVINGVRRQCQRRQGEEPGRGIHGDSPGGPGLHDLAQWRLHQCRPQRGHRSARRRPRRRPAALGAGLAVRIWHGLRVGRRAIRPPTSAG